MRSPVDDEDDAEELRRLNAAPWMVGLLDLNPEYPHWGPDEDYMISKGKGWNSPMRLATWSEVFDLDELNECVNFYFEIRRDSKQCETCGGNGYHPDAHWVTESFYRHSSPFTYETWQETQSKALLASFGGNEHASILGRGAGMPPPSLALKYGPSFSAFSEEMAVHGCWNDRITEDEVAALAEGQRIRGACAWVEGKGWQPVEGFVMPTAAEVNLQQHGGGLSGHDAINRSILVEARLKRLGIPKDCPECAGHGHVFTEPAAHVGLVLWILHPRKGASRGVDVAKIEEVDLPAVFSWLRGAAVRNAERFSKLEGR